MYFFVTIYKKNYSIDCNIEFYNRYNRYMNIYVNTYNYWNY